MTDGSRVGNRHDLRVNVGDGVSSLDVGVVAADLHTIGELGERVGELIGRPTSGGLWCVRRAEALDPRLTLAESGVRWGDELLLSEGVREPIRVGGVGRVELVVSAGPCAGERWELDYGSYRLGRDLDADVHIADPSLSRHHLDLTVGEGGVTVADAGSANGTAIDGVSLVPRRDHPLGEQVEVELGRTMVRARRLAPSVDPGLPLRGGRLDFNRPPRVGGRPEPFQRDLPAPPSHGRQARLPLAAALLPLFAGVLLFIILDSAVMLAIAGLSPLMALGSYWGDRRGGKKTFAKEAAEFREGVESAIEDLDTALAEETVQRRAEMPDAPTVIARVREHAPSLWERRPADEDFLALRVGVGDLAARSEVSIARGGDRELRREVEESIAERKTVPSVPVPVELAKVGVLGLTGPQSATSGLARWLMLQAATLQSPDDLVVVAAVGEETAAEWSWLKWLSHLRPQRLGIQAPAVTVGREAAEEMLGEVEDFLKAAAALDRLPGQRPACHLLMLLDERLGLDRGLVRGVLGDAAGHGVSAIWLGRDVRDLPGQVGAIVEAREDRAALDLTEVRSGVRFEDVSADSVSLELATNTARLLAPLRDVGESGRGGAIPQRVGLLEVLGLLPPDPEALRRRWERWDGELQVVVGVGADGPLTLDLRREGPHALIAGTTGSGKSEMLRTFVASAAATIPPDRLIFLLVDYKGGSAFAPCAGLPHVVDVVSDLDGHLAERALVSLDAELKRRERTLAEHGAKDLQSLIRRAPADAPPTLVIAVDEFAKLREEIPEFVDGVVDIAQRGRSLGVHMVLAAQTLRNALTPAIRANTNLRVALRVADESESGDVIASPLAARIPSGDGARGRAFVRTGSGDEELREFQTAYVSGRSAAAEELELKLWPFELTELELPAAVDGHSPDGEAEGDLTALAEAAQKARAQMALPAPPRPWLPVLPEILGLDGLDDADRAPGVAAVGLLDLPHLQKQQALAIDLPSVGHVAVFGSGNSGKTTFLTSLALALAESSRPEELALYGLDAAGGHLAPLAGLPHCGGVVSVEDEERVERLFRVLLRRIEERVAARRTPDPVGGRPVQRCVLILDDLGSFAQQYDRPGFDTSYESLQRVLSGGRSASVHVVLTAGRRGDLPAALGAHVGQRLALQLPTEDDMRALGLDAKVVKAVHLPPGRGFTFDSHEFHTAVPAMDGTPLTLEQAIDRIPEEGAGAVRSIDVLPDAVGVSSLGRPESIEAVPLGVGDEELEVVAIDLADRHFMVSGPYRSGRSTALATIAAGVRLAEPGASLHLLAPRRSALRDLDVWDGASTTAEGCAEAVDSLARAAESGELEKRTTFVFVDDGGELTDAATISHLERLVRIGRDTPLTIVAGVESAAARGIGMGWIRELRREGHGLLLQPDLAADGDLLGARLPHRVSSPMLPGRGFLVRGGTAELIQVGS